MKIDFTILQSILQLNVYIKLAASNESLSLLVIKYFKTRCSIMIPPIFQKSVFGPNIS